ARNVTGVQTCALPISLIAYQQRRAGLSTAARSGVHFIVDWLGWLCYYLAVNVNGYDRSNHFRDPKRIPDANRSEQPAEYKRSRETGSASCRASARTTA